MKYALLILISLLGNECFAQQMVAYQPVVLYPVIVYQPVVVQQTTYVPVVEQRVNYVPVQQVVLVQPQGYWIHDRGWLLCKERWRYVPYNY